MVISLWTRLPSASHLLVRRKQDLPASAFEKLIGPKTAVYFCTIDLFSWLQVTSEDLPLLAI